MMNAFLVMLTEEELDFVEDVLLAEEDKDWDAHTELLIHRLLERLDAARHGD